MWQKSVKKTVFTVVVDNYAPEVTDLTFPFMKLWAKKIGADFHVITERKFPHLPPPCEKFQVHELAQQMENDWNIYLDADAWVHPEAPDFTHLVHKDTVLHHGRDVAMVRWKYDRYFWRDGRNIGSANWCSMASDWCVDLWKPIDDLTLEEILDNINPTPLEVLAGIDKHHLIDDYTLSRNIARYGLKCTTILENHDKLGIAPNKGFFWHEYTIPIDEKVKRLKKLISAGFIKMFPVGTFDLSHTTENTKKIEDIPMVPLPLDKSLPIVITPEIQEWETTEFGTFWAPKGDKSPESVLVELSSAVYGPVNRGEVVLDCGAYIGLFARWALAHGAAKVICIEPYPVSMACLKKNLEAEIEHGTAFVGEGAVWNKDGRAKLSINPFYTSQNSMLISRNLKNAEVEVSTMTIDQVVIDVMGLERLDFIKMDIEGAEGLALQGAEKTIAKFKPRLAIATEHFVGDAEELRGVIHSLCPDYEFELVNQVIMATVPVPVEVHA